MRQAYTPNRRDPPLGDEQLARLNLELAKRLEADGAASVAGGLCSRRGLYTTPMPWHGTRHAGLKACHCAPGFYGEQCECGPGEACSCTLSPAYFRPKLLCPPSADAHTHSSYHVTQALLARRNRSATACTTARAAASASSIGAIACLALGASTALLGSQMHAWHSAWSRSRRRCRSNRRRPPTVCSAGRRICRACRSQRCPRRARSCGSLSTTYRQSSMFGWPRTFGARDGGTNPTSTLLTRRSTGALLLVHGRGHANAYYVYTGAATLGIYACLCILITRSLACAQVAAEITIPHARSCRG